MTAEISVLTNPVVWIEHVIVLSAALPQSSLYRFDQSLMKISHKRNMSFMNVSDGSMLENILKNITSSGRPER